MAKTLREWVDTDVRRIKDKPIEWLSQHYFFRDPLRPTYADSRFFFAPADGIVLYQKVVAPDDPILDVKGRTYSLRDAMRDSTYDRTCLVIGIFMTFYDVHVNRIPYPGRLTYRHLEPIHTYNRPMLAIEKTILEELRISLDEAGYLHENERMINRVDSVELGQSYYMMQIADYDIGNITPFVLRQNHPFTQGERFSAVRYGSQVDLVIPLSPRFDFRTTQPTGCHVEAGVDRLVEVVQKANGELTDSEVSHGV